MSESSSVVTFQTAAERSRRMVELRVAGASLDQIARLFKVKQQTVINALNDLLPALDIETRARYLRESIQQLDSLNSYWWAQARTSTAAASLCLRICEQRALLLGLNAPVRLDPVRVTVGNGPAEGSTEQLIAELNRIAEEKKPALQLVSLSDEPSPEPDPPA
jgi:hypothetical protein